MSRSERALMLRQAALQQRSAQLRDRWGRDAEAFEPLLGTADLAVDGWRWLRAHPEWPVGLLAVAVVWRPRRLWRWGVRAVWTWRLWRRVRPLVRPFLQGLQRQGASTPG